MLVIVGIGVGLGVTVGIGVGLSRWVAVGVCVGGITLSAPPSLHDAQSKDKLTATVARDRRFMDALSR